MVMTQFRFQAEVLFNNGRISKTRVSEGADGPQTMVIEDMRSSIAAFVRRRVAEPNPETKGVALVHVTYRESPKKQTTTFKVAGVTPNGA
jgi:hypothetical protein